MILASRDEDLSSPCSMNVITLQVSGACRMRSRLSPTIALDLHSVSPRLRSAACRVNLALSHACTASDLAPQTRPALGQVQYFALWTNDMCTTLPQYSIRHLACTHWAERLRICNTQDRRAALVFNFMVCRAMGQRTRVPYR